MSRKRNVCPCGKPASRVAGKFCSRQCCSKGQIVLVDEGLALSEYGNGKPLKQIGVVLGIDKKSVRKILREAGISDARRNLSYLRVCTTCNASFDHRSPHAITCKNCLDALAKIKNAERMRVYHKTHKKTPKARNRKKEYENNRDKINARTSACRARRREHYREVARRRVAANRLSGNKFRARSSYPKPTWIAGDVWGMMIAQSGRCANTEYCMNNLMEFHVDHANPLARGGSNDLDNLQLLCPMCNLRKNSKTMEEFVSWQFRRKELGLL